MIVHSVKTSMRPDKKSSKLEFRLLPLYLDKSSLVKIYRNYEYLKK